MTVRADDRFANAPMTPVTCRSCGADVLVRKSSWEQTSVQWDARSLARCSERAEILQHPEAADRLGLARPGLFLVCARLRDSIESAVGEGALLVSGES